MPFTETKLRPKKKSTKGYHVTVPNKSKYKNSEYHRTSTFQILMDLHANKWGQKSKGLQRVTAALTCLRKKYSSFDNLLDHLFSTFLVLLLTLGIYRTPSISLFFAGKRLSIFIVLEIKTEYLYVLLFSSCYHVSFWMKKMWLH